MARIKLTKENEPEENPTSKTEALAKDLEFSEYTQNKRLLIAIVTILLFRPTKMF